MLRLPLRNVYSLSRRSFTFSLINKNPTKIKMPSLSPTMSEGTIVQWNKKEGETVAAGDVLCEIQTDKAVVSMEAEEDGILAKIIKNTSSGTVIVGELIGVLAETDEDWKNLSIPPEWFEKPAVAAGESSSKKAESSPSPPAASSTATTTGGSSSGSSASQTTGHDEYYGPAVRLLLHQHNLRAEQVPATGHKGRLLKEDVLHFIQNGGASAAGASTSSSSSVSSSSGGVGGASDGNLGYVDIPLTSMRKTIAKRLAQSKSSIPHAYTGIRFDVAAIQNAREVLKNCHGIKLSVNDYVIKACALALKQVPEVNSSYAGEDVGGQANASVDVSIAVATKAGLITPIVHNADQLSLVEINTKVKQLAEKARANKLQPKEFQGGTFTISNLGMYGVREFTAIINPPQSCILAVGGTEIRAVVNSTSKSTKSIDDLQIKAQETVTVTMSSDARVVDGNCAGKFLLILKQILENPDRYLHDGLPQTSHVKDFDALVGDTLGLGLM